MESLELIHAQRRGFLLGPLFPRDNAGCEILLGPGAVLVFQGHLDLPEFLPAAGVVQVLGGEAQESGIGMEGLIPKGGSAAEGAGPVVDSAGDPDAQSMGGATALPAHDSLQVVDVLEDPYKLLRLHQVEGNSAGDGLALGYDALGDIQDNRSLDQAGSGPRSRPCPAVSG